MLGSRQHGSCAGTTCEILKSFTVFKQPHVVGNFHLLPAGLLARRCCVSGCFCDRPFRLLFYWFPYCIYRVKDGAILSLLCHTTCGTYFRATLSLVRELALGEALHVYQNGYSGMVSSSGGWSDPFSNSLRLKSTRSSPTEMFRLISQSEENLQFFHDLCLPNPSRCVVQ